jgi:STE24 endopeptidase
VLELLSLPLMTAISRRWERYADRFSLELTGDSAAFESTFRTLGVKNLSDLDPPPALYYALFSHPTIPERIAFGRRWSAARHPA